MRKYISTYPNRTLCEVLEEMRKCVKTSNYSYLSGLIEEAQSMGNRMEAGLSDLKDIRDARDVIKELSVEFKELSLELKELESKKESLEKGELNCKKSK